MGYDVSIKGRKKAPNWHLSYTTGYLLCRRCPEILGVLRYGQKDVVSHESQDIVEALHGLNRFLGKYVPRGTRVLDISPPSIIELFEPDDELKFSAYHLRKVIQYAVDNRRDVFVSG